MRRSAAFQRIAWLVMAALLAQSWLGHFMTSAAAAKRDAIVICTGGGFKVFYLPDDIGPPSLDPSVPENEHRQQGQDCTVCLAHALGQWQPSAALYRVPWRGREHVATAVSDQLPSVRLRHDAHRSRAPPRV